MLLDGAIKFKPAAVICFITVFTRELLFVFFKLVF